MAEWLQVLALALLQGITEFLPVSSSAHLILPAQLFGWTDQGLLFDVAVHAGTLCAVLWYFRDTCIGLLRALLPGASLDRTELWSLCLATIPVVVVGAGLKDVIASEARSVGVIVATTLIFGVLLGVADRFAKRAESHLEKVSYRDALWIGVAQVFALIPGTSRSGVTITAALFLGYHPSVATRFSFLLSIPVIAGALLVMLVSPTSGSASLTLLQLLAAFVLSAGFAYVTIMGFMHLVSRIGLMPFVLYRLLLGILLWGWVVGG